MGCAYGNVVLAALNAGAAQVIACDMEKEHLKILEQAVHYKDVDRLQTIQGSFPKHFDFSNIDTRIFRCKIPISANKC